MIYVLDMVTTLPQRLFLGNLWRRAQCLFAFLTVERGQRSIASRERQDLERLLIIVALGITFLAYVAPIHVGIFLNLYFLPVSLSAFYLGRYRAGLAAILCMACAIYVISVSHQASVPPLELASWCSVLTLSALFIGTLSDEVNNRFDKVVEDHVSENRTDALTHVANRRSFDIEIKRALESFEQEEASFCLVFVDIDFFKRFNDTYGHPAGDKVLHDVARSLESTVRQCDVVFRYGGEEFAILMPGLSMDDALSVSERLRREIEATRFFHNRAKLRLTVSVGVTEPKPDDDVATVVQRADEALYTSKQSGRNCVHYDTGAGCQHFGAPLPVAQECSGPGTRAKLTHYEDSVTGLPSRRVFIHELTRRLAEATRYGSSFSIVMLKISALEAIERLGEAVVDRALTVVSELTRGVMRDSDLIVRYSHDCLAILMPSTSADEALAPVIRLLEEIETCDTMRYRGNVVYMSADAGIATAAGEDVSDLIQQAMDQMSSVRLMRSASAPPEGVCGSE